MPGEEDRRNKAGIINNSNDTTTTTTPHKIPPPIKSKPKALSGNALTAAAISRSATASPVPPPPRKSKSLGKKKRQVSPPPPPLPSRSSQDICNDDEGDDDSIIPPLPPRPSTTSPVPPPLPQRHNQSTRPSSAYLAKFSDDNYLSDETSSDSNSNGNNTNNNNDPDSSQYSRKPPTLHGSGGHQWPNLSVKDVRAISVHGSLLYTASASGSSKIWDLKSGHLVWEMSHSESSGSNRITAAKFKTKSKNSIWVGFKDGLLLEIGCNSKNHGVVHAKRSSAHSSPIKRIFSFDNEMWTLDSDGRVQVWTRDEFNTDPDLSSTPRTFRVPGPNHTCVAVRCANGQRVLWVARNKQINCFRPHGGDANVPFNILPRPLSVPTGIGDITCGAVLPVSGDYVYFGHDSGHVSVFDTVKMTCVDIIHISVYRLVTLVGCGLYLWASFKTGMTYIYDVSLKPWKVVKAWKSHSSSVSLMDVDNYSILDNDYLPVVSAGSDNIIKSWDGQLKSDWLNNHLLNHAKDFCKMNPLNILIVSWNVGACKPSDVENTSSTQNYHFFRDLFDKAAATTNPDIIVFGFQELVELDDKALAAKSMLKLGGGTPNNNNNNHSSNSSNSLPATAAAASAAGTTPNESYREWTRYLEQQVYDNIPDCEYRVVKTDGMMGLFSCVFASTKICRGLHDIESTNVKTGFGGLHGNKGALMIRMLINDSPLCFVNCHLSAGQNHTQQRNNDITSIIESDGFSSCKKNTNYSYIGGGDGSMILDHEQCFLNGDFNYRINLPRQAVMSLIEKGQLTNLLERDQLTMQRNKNPGFRLRSFNESKITFLPTYKYDLLSDCYDSSDKKRIPAWCDRILYRGEDVDCLLYTRLEAKVSDHRPVIAILSSRFKTVQKDKLHDALIASDDAWINHVDTLANEISENISSY